MEDHRIVCRHLVIFVAASVSIADQINEFDQHGPPAKGPEGGQPPDISIKPRGFHASVFGHGKHYIVQSKTSTELELK